MKFKTKNGYDFFEVTSAFQKCVRRGLEDDAMYWARELFESGYSEYAWRRIMIVATEDIGLADPAVAVQINSLYFIFKNLEKHDKVKVEGNCTLPFTQAVLICVRAKKSRLVDETLTLHFQYSKEHFGRKPIPDFALDMHTRRGKALGRDNQHFYDESGILSNQADVDREAEITGIIKQKLGVK